MQSAVPPSNEESRLEALLRYRVLDTDAETAYDDLTEIAAEICKTPICLVSLIDKNRQWFKSHTGLDARETPRDLAFCAHAILQNDLFVVNDTLEDERFVDNPLVTGDPKIRFYAGAPLITSDNYALGTLCVIDREPRELSESQKNSLQALSRQVLSQLELRFHSIQLEKQNHIRERLMTTIAHDLKSSFNAIVGFAKALGKRSDRMTPKDIGHAVYRIEHSGERAHKILVSLLEWSQQQIDDKRKETTRFPVKKVCEEVIELLQDLSEEKKIRIDLECEENLHIVTNECLLYSTLQNLTSNAVKFSHPDSDIHIRVVDQSEGVWFSIKDEGLGMQPEVAQKIYQGEGSQTTVGTMGELGTGIGTLLVRDYVNSVGGKLDVETDIGQGCCVTFTVPQRYTGHAHQ